MVLLVIMIIYRHLSQIVRNLLSGHNQVKLMFLMVYVGLVGFSLTTYDLSSPQKATPQGPVSLRKIAPIAFLMTVVHMYPKFFGRPGLRGISDTLSLTTTLSLFYFAVGDAMLLRDRFFYAITLFVTAYMMLTLGLSSRLKHHFGFDDSLHFMTFLYKATVNIIYSHIVCLFPPTHAHRRTVGLALLSLFVVSFVLQEDQHFLLMLLYFTIALNMVSLQIVWPSLEDSEAAKHGGVAGVVCIAFNVNLVLCKFTTLGLSFYQIEFRLIYYFMCCFIAMSALY